MEQAKLQNFKVTEGEYGSILEVLYHSIEAKKYDLTERDCFDEINDFVTLNSIRKRFLADGYLEKGLFIYPLEIPCLLKHINQFLSTEVNKETISELESVKNKIKNLVQQIVVSFDEPQNAPRRVNVC